MSSDNERTCSSANFSTNGTSYQRVCGRARGYQKGYTLAFYGTGSSRAIDRDYASRLSITYSSNPCQHIWTFASGFSETHITSRICPCSDYRGGDPSTSFTGNNYYCESGTVNYYINSGGVYYFNDTLWDGAGCAGGNCCDDTTQPWFYRQLNQMIQDI